MTVGLECRHPGEAILSEGNRSISRDNGVIAGGVHVDANALLGRVLIPAQTTVTRAAYGENLGNGDLTLADPPISEHAVSGTYRVTCIEPAAGGGTFLVSTPSGVDLGSARVGAVLDGDVKFAISDGTVDFEAGDGFTITVTMTEDAYVLVPYDPAANDGSEIPVAYSIYTVATDENETKHAAIISRLAELNGALIAWPEGITDDQKAGAAKSLAERKIIIR
ncbi:hypothetical protein AFEL58S_01627 [Afipia felis]